MDSPFFTNPSGLLRKAILPGLGEFGKKTKPSNALALNFLNYYHLNQQLVKSTVQPWCFTVRCFQFVFQYDVDSNIWQIYNFSILPCHSFSAFRFSHLVVVAMLYPFYKSSRSFLNPVSYKLRIAI